MIKVLGPPIAMFMDRANQVLLSMSMGNDILLALLLGAMIAFDMGGPVNKTAFFFGAAMISQGNYQIMGTCAADPASRSSVLHSFLRINVASPIPNGGVQIAAAQVPII